MKYIGILILGLLMASCGETRLQEQKNENGVLILPDDSSAYKTPIKDMDTSQSSMPVLNTDTAIVIPQ